MTIDLDALLELHPDLPEEIAAALALAAAFALERRQRAGVVLVVDLAGQAKQEKLVWIQRAGGANFKLDGKRATEDGAEAIALGIVGVHRPRWRLARRLQQGEGADWLFEIDGTPDTIALEVSGTDDGSLGARMHAKREQARTATAGRPAAFVVRFLDPKASLWESDGPP